MKKSSGNAYELTPLRSSNNNVSYTSINKDDSNQNAKNKQLTNCDLTLFTFQQWNMYLSRTIVYPYAKVYALYYNMSLTTFSYIMSAFDMGGCIAVLVTILPSFNRIPLHQCLFTVLILTCFVNFGMTLFNSFAALMALRMLTGLFATICSAQIRGTLGVTLKNKSAEIQSRLTFGIMLIESAWTSATFGWMFIGIALNRISINSGWYIISFAALIGAAFCYFCPRFSIFEATLSKPSQRQTISHSTVIPINNTQQQQQTIANPPTQKHWIFAFSKAYTLHLLYLGMFMNGIPFYCFFSTFGGFVQTTFDLNPEQLGVVTLTITAAELSALISSSCIAKFKSNMFIVLVGSASGLVVFVSFLLLIAYNALTVINTMVILYFFTYTIELSYLNSIVCTLHFSPPGYEATASLIGQFVSRASSILAVIIGAHIVEWKGYSFLIEMLIVCQFVSIIIFWWLKRLFWKSQIQKQKQLSSNQN